MISHDELLRGALQKMKRSLSSTRSCLTHVRGLAQRNFLQVLVSHHVRGACMPNLGLKLLHWSLEGTHVHWPVRQALAKAYLGHCWVHRHFASGLSRWHLEKINLSKLETRRDDHPLLRTQLPGIQEHTSVVHIILFEISYTSLSTGCARHVRAQSKNWSTNKKRFEPYAFSLWSIYSISNNKKKRAEQS
jgi:hypothetical protein